MNWRPSHDSASLKLISNVRRYIPYLVIAASLLIAAGTIFGATRLAANLSEKEDAGQSDEHAGHASTATSDEPMLDLTNLDQVSIDIRNYSFASPNITIRKGTTVTWTNFDMVEHNAMQKHDDDDHSHNASSPGEVRPDTFSGPLLAAGERYSHTFTRTGTISYHCAPHPSMVGFVTVVD